MYNFRSNFIKNKLILIDCLLIQTVLLRKSNQEMFMKNFLDTNTCLTLVKLDMSFSSIILMSFR